jgi:predicted ATPase
LSSLGLGYYVDARRIDETQIELYVGIREGIGPDELDGLFSVADTGSGVGAALPVIVALVAAVPGQIVYLEQPENDLHPRAQAALSTILVSAAKRGVRVIVETHSSLLLLGIQTLVAEGKLDSELVKLHWFSLNDEGVTEITSADLDESGAFGEDWPEDFAEVELDAESRYLDAAEKRLVER